MDNRVNNVFFIRFLNILRIDAGLRIEYLHEYPFSVYGQLAMLRQDGKGYWHFPEGAKPIPLMYSLKAGKM